MDKHQQGHKDTLLQPQHHDRDMETRHFAGAAHCPSCGANFHAGRWSWQALDAGARAEEATCPACKRIAEKAAAGTVTLSGAFVQAHREEILNLIRNTEALENKEHALERLIDIADEEDAVVVTTTGMHLANRIGHALDSAYDGSTRYTYSDDKTHLDVDWERD